MIARKTVTRCRVVTEDQLREIWRAYLQERVDQCGGERAFERETGIPHGNVSRVLGGQGNVPESWIAKIAASRIGPSVAEIYAIIGLRCANASPKGSIAGYVRIPATKARGIVKEEFADLAAGEVAAARRDLEEGREGHEQSDAPPRKGRAERHRRPPRGS